MRLLKAFLVLAIFGMMVGLSYQKKLPFNFSLENVEKPGSLQLELRGIFDEFETDFAVVQDTLRYYLAEYGPELSKGNIRWGMSLSNTELNGQKLTVEERTDNFLFWVQLDFSSKADRFNWVVDIVNSPNVKLVLDPFTTEYAKGKVYAKLPIPDRGDEMLELDGLRFYLRNV